ncbi:outer membrane protein, OMP85 family protein [Entamoeba histolytica HM-1:IMSS-B]|uniref:Outer membrane protein, OMP85 family protein n=1 Tax=Entamoeba histolytica HM-1:IMSS-B TaxID=885319 RepID=M3TAL0_ENTH1|nr:outer membrane protein, OMP85 family protein [Entamoeba histolytica HM-1:IMSS-B]
MEGGWASTYLIDQSKTRLERLGYFKEVKVETPQVPGTDDMVDVNYNVEEQPSGSITASIGFAQSAGLILGGSISQNNFLGTGNQVSIGLTRSQYQSRYNFSFTDPYFTPDGVSLGYNIFYRSTDYSKLYDSDVSYYSINSLGTGVTLGYPISETSRLTYGLSVQKDEINPGTYSADEIYDFVDREGDNFTNFKASIGWSSSTLNRGVLPTRGASQSMTGQITIPGSDLSFYKLDYRGQLFTPLTDTTALRFHTELGYGDSYGSTDGLPFYENYYAGGFNSVRGFEDSSLGPRTTPPRNPPTFSGKGQGYRDRDNSEAFGGNVLITGGVEYLFPLPFVKDQKSLRTVLFWDVGNVFSTGNCYKTPDGQDGTKNCGDISLSNMASSVGMALLESDAAKKYAVDSEKKFGPQLNKLKGLESSAKDIQDKLNKGGDKMAQAERTRLENDFRQKARDFQFQSKELNDAKAASDRDMLKLLKPRLDKAVEEVLKKGDYDLVLERGAVVDVKPQYDITRQVIERMNAGR